jgi:hypothetical protein
LIKQNSSFPLTIMKSKFHNTYKKYDYNITLKISRIARVISSLLPGAETQGGDPGAGAPGKKKKKKSSKFL